MVDPRQRTARDPPPVDRNRAVDMAEENMPDVFMTADRFGEGFVIFKLDPVHIGHADIERR